MRGTTMAIAGTRDHTDVWDDITKVPFSMTEHATRYAAAEAILKQRTVDTVIGHSLGGVTALELQEHYPYLHTRTYGAPVVSATRGARYRHFGDPISALDWGAHTSLPSGLNPHSYHGY